MSHPIPLRRRLFITACAMTRTTELAARRLGTARFLPALFVLRYANMGGLDPDTFASELAQARSFTDDRWCAHWDSIAHVHLDAAQAALAELADGIAPELRDVLDAQRNELVEQVASLLAPAAPWLADHGPQPSHSALARLADEQAGQPRDSDLVLAAIALDEIVKALTYFQVSAFPGGSPTRMRAYANSRRLSGLLVAILAAGLDVTIEQFSVQAGGEVVSGYAVLPDETRPVPGVLVTNGLEGTVQEVLIPNLRYRHSGMAAFVMEMPGTYGYRQPMSDSTEAIYDAVIDHIAQDPRIDSERLGMVGVSLGGYWSARLAATNPRLRCAVSCGAPTHHSFGPASSIGMSQVLVEAFAKVNGATNPIALSRRMRALSLRDQYASIRIPLLVINGDTDTLVSTRDSVELAQAAPQGELKLFPNDDHCAMGHYHEWLELSQHWLANLLTAEMAVR